MPRKARTKSSTGIYHIIIRSVNQQLIFEEDADYQKFLYILSDCKQQYQFNLFAYCLMSNHIHLLVKDNQDNLSSFMNSLESKFVRWYNIKYNRYGHLFQGRFHSIPIETDKSFLQVLLYIHENPVKSNICKYSTEYRWSSCSEYYSKKETWIDTSFAIGIFDSRFDLLAYFHQHTSDKISEITEPSTPLHRYTDERALEIFKQISHCNSPADVQKLGKVPRNELIAKLCSLNLTHKQIARFCGISRITVSRIHKRYRLDANVHTQQK